MLRFLSILTLFVATLGAAVHVDMRCTECEAWAVWSLYILALSGTLFWSLIICIIASAMGDRS